MILDGFIMILYDLIFNKLNFLILCGLELAESRLEPVVFCVFCECVFSPPCVAFLNIFCHNIIIFRNPWFYHSETEVCEGISSCVMEAKKWPTSILAVRRVKTALSCENGMHFREGTQRVFACELHMMVG